MVREQQDQGALSSFEQVFLHHHAKVYRLILRVVGDAQEAEDLTQETFMRLHHHFEKIELERVHHWLHRVAVNFGLKALRGKKRFVVWQHKAGEQAKALYAGQEPGDPLEAALVRDVLRTLSERQAQLLLLHMAGLRYEELAETLEIQRSSVSQLLSRARKAFEKEYARRATPQQSHDSDSSFEAKL